VGEKFFVHMLCGLVAAIFGLPLGPAFALAYSSAACLEFSQHKMNSISHFPSALPMSPYWFLTQWQ
jgi:hypothetical protein